MINLPSQKIALAAVVDPKNGNNAANASGYLDMRKFRQALFILQTGAIDQTVDFKLQEAKDASGTGVQDLPGKAITQLNNTNSSKQALINVRAEELDVNLGYAFVRAVATVGNGTSSLINVVGLGLEPVFAPASASNLASVVQVVS
jgi:hypothetical protein